MQAADQQVLSRIQSWLEDGQHCWLATVVETYGSSPRPAGSIMTCNASGVIVGSLSGGCVEDDLLEKLQDGQLAQRTPQFFRYGETDEEAEQLGLPCGGHLDIVVEPLMPNDANRAVFSHIKKRLDDRKSVLRTCRLETGSMHASDSEAFQDFQVDDGRTVLKQTYGPRFQLIVIGSGMVSQYVAEMAIALDYQVTVCDPRQENIDAFSVEGVDKVCDMPDDVILARGTDNQTAIVALTHDPRIDDMGLLGAFETNAFYIGAMGSSRTSANRIARLRELDVSPEQLARLHAPIGLPIGSKTPPEIAVSILAEITAVRHGAIATIQAAETELETERVTA